MNELFGSGDFRQNLFYGAIESGAFTAADLAKFGYGYVTDPQNRENTAQNARQFVDNFGKYTPNGREFIFADLSSPNTTAQSQAQSQQLKDIKQLRDPTNGRWNVRTQTGFDDEYDDDRARSQSSAALNRQQRSNEMQTPTSTNIYSNRPSDYKPTYNSSSPSERLVEGFAKIQADAYNAARNNQLQSADRRDTARVNAAVTREVGLAGVNANFQLGQFKTLADLQSNLDRNRAYRDIGFEDARVKQVVGLDSNTKNLQGAKYKVDAEKDLGKYQWSNINKTAIAEAQIKAGTYGRSQSDINSMQIESNARKVNNEYNDRMMQYGRYQMEIANFQNSIANANRSYGDQRFDRRQDRADAMARFNREQAQKEADRAEYYRQQNLDRQLKRDDFALRSQQIQNQIAQTNQEFALRQQEFALRSAESAAKVNQIYSDTRLKNDQFGATRSDIGYNRLQQRRSMAF